MPDTIGGLMSRVEATFMVEPPVLVEGGGAPELIRPLPRVLFRIKPGTVERRPSGFGLSRRVQWLPRIVIPLRVLKFSRVWITTVTTVAKGTSVSIWLVVGGPTTASLLSTNSPSRFRPSIVKSRTRAPVSL